jgi:DNA-binding PadR family transcriptional regulator
MKGGGHGYDLRKSIAELSEDAISVDAGGLYRTLRRMEEEGFVTSKWVEGDSGPQKREYDLTAAGHELAEDWIEHLRERATLASMLADELERACAEGAGEGSTDG